MRRIIWLLIPLALCFSSVEAANLPPALTLDQAFALAIQNNPQFKAEQAHLGIGEAELKTAGGRLNPFLMSDNGIAERTYRLGVEQVLEIGGKRQRRLDLANTQLKATRANINTRLLELRADVRRAYTQLYNAQERQKTYENILQVTQELVEIAKKREQAGDIATLDVLQTEIINVNTNNDLQTVALEVTQSKNRMNSLLNQSLGNDLTIAPPNTLPQLGMEMSLLPMPSTGPVLHGSVQVVDMELDRLIQQALAHRPEVKSNLAQIEVTQRQLALAQAYLIPNLMLAAGRDRVTGQGGGLSAFIMGNLEIPLYNRQQGPIAEALAHQSQLKQETLAQKNRVALEVTNAYTAFIGNQARLQRYETQLLPYAVAVVDKSRRAFQEGKTSILTPINAQQAYMNSRLGYLQALMDSQNAISDLERAVGAGL